MEWHYREIGEAIGKTKKKKKNSQKGVESLFLEVLCETCLLILCRSRLDYAGQCS